MFDMPMKKNLERNDFYVMGLSDFLTDRWFYLLGRKIIDELGEMAAARGLVLSRPVTFVTGNAKKLEEVRAILGNSIPFQSLKLDCNNIITLQAFFFTITCSSFVLFGFLDFFFFY